MSTGKPFDVSCPTCGAAVGAWCTVRGVRLASGPHSRRVKLSHAAKRAAPMPAFIFGHWHAWDNANPFGPRIMLSDESMGKLYEFADVDSCITWLYAQGYKDAARALNAHKKA